MNDLVVKKVDLCGDAIMAAQDKDGQVWAGVKWLCDGLGLTEDQDLARLRHELLFHGRPLPGQCPVWSCRE